MEVSGVLLCIQRRGGVAGSGVASGVTKPVLVGLFCRYVLVAIYENYPFSVTTKNDNLSLPFLGCNYPIFLLYNIYQLLYIYINWFNWIIFICDFICYTKYWG